MFAFFPMVINTYQGVKNADSKLLEVGRSVPLLRNGNVEEHRAARRAGVHRPRLKAGARPRPDGMVLADLYTAISGIGYLIVRTASTYQVDKMFVRSWFWDF